MDKTTKSKTAVIVPSQMGTENMFYPEKDRVFEDVPLEGGHWQSRFRFDESVARVFDDMALRSIPLYRESLDAIADWASRFATPGSRVFDLGCSTGSALVAAMSRVEKDRCEFIGVDASAEMLARADAKIRRVFPDHSLELLQEDVTRSDLRGASVVILHYTMQFVPVSERRFFMNRIYDSLQKGGLLYIGDKLSLTGHTTAALMTDRYHRFKEEQGYSKLEIERKRAALEQVLVPYTLNEELDVIEEAGFAECEVILKWNQFASIVAIK